MSEPGQPQNFRQWYFRMRGYTLLPFYLAVLAIPVQFRDPRWKLWWAVGGAVALSGMLLRLWAIRHIGKSARTRTEKTRPLVLTGPYAALRNPLYVGNTLIAGGFAVCGSLPWYGLGLGILTFVHYHVVVLCEEDGLLERHGEEYAAFLKEVPRWFPRIRKEVFAPAPHPLGEAIYRERSGVLGMAIATALLAARTWWDFLR